MSAPTLSVKSRSFSRCLDTADRCLLLEEINQARLAGQIVSGAGSRGTVDVNSCGRRSPDSSDCFTSRDADAECRSRLTLAPSRLTGTELHGKHKRREIKGDINRDALA